MSVDELKAAIDSLTKAEAKAVIMWAMDNMERECAICAYAIPCEREKVDYKSDACKKYLFLSALKERSAMLLNGELTKEDMKIGEDEVIAKNATSVGVIKAAFLIKDYCHEHLSGRNGGCKTCPLSNFRMWNESVRGCAVSRPANWTIRK